MDRTQAALPPGLRHIAYGSILNWPWPPDPTTGIMRCPATRSMKTPRTDKALDDVAGILPCLALSDAGREQVATELAHVRGVPSAVVRCAGALSIIDALVRRASQIGALHALSNALEQLRNLRKGLEAELNQARARATVGCS